MSDRWAGLAVGFRCAAVIICRACGRINNLTAAADEAQQGVALDALLTVLLVGERMQCAVNLVCSVMSYVS